MEQLSQILAKSKKLFILTGAGISKESGIETFTDSKDGLWANYNIEDVCTPLAFQRNPDLVYEFYNKRRQELNSGIKPNKAHKLLVELEKALEINIITQNIDNLHEISGSSSIIHMHGELNKVRCIMDESHIFEWYENLDETHKCPHCGAQMRPHVCFYGEMPYQMDEIHNLAMECSLFVSIGTSGGTYPAAGFVSLFKEMKKPTVELNLEPSLNQSQFDFAIHKPATVAVEEFKNLILNN